MQHHSWQEPTSPIMWQRISSPGRCTGSGCILDSTPTLSNLEYKLVRSWAKFVCRAATEGINNIWDLLPRYTSLAQPPAATMDYLEYLVATIQSLIGPLPVTDWSLQQQPESYLPWLHLVLLDFHDVQGAPHAPKLFTMLPQSSNHTHFITISSTSPHK